MLMINQGNSKPIYVEKKCIILQNANSENQLTVGVDFRRVETSLKIFNTVGTDTALNYSQLHGQTFYHHSHRI